MHILRIFLNILKKMLTFDIWVYIYICIYIYIHIFVHLVLYWNWMFLVCFSHEDGWNSPISGFFSPRGTPGVGAKGHGLVTLACPFR